MALPDPCMSGDGENKVIKGKKKLMTEHHLEFLSLKGGCTGWSESTLVKIPHSRKSHTTALIMNIYDISIHSIEPNIISRLPIVQGGTITFVTPAIAILSLDRWECPYTEARTGE